MSQGKNGNTYWEMSEMLMVAQRKRWGDRQKQAVVRNEMVQMSDGTRGAVHKTDSMGCIVNHVRAGRSCSLDNTWPDEGGYHDRTNL